MKAIRKHLFLFILNSFYFVLSALIFIAVPEYWYVWLTMITISIATGMIIIYRPKAVDMFVEWFRSPMTMNCGDSMRFLGCQYQRGEPVELNINDKVIIHPVPGKSQAIKSYPGRIAVNVVVNGRDGWAEGIISVLVVEGIEDNKEWKGAWMNDYLFGRLEFVSRNYKGE
jgi:hypothetical protein